MAEQIIDLETSMRMNAEGCSSFDDYLDKKLDEIIKRIDGSAERLYTPDEMREHLGAKWGSYARKCPLTRGATSD
ncbi:MAG: hypothetical protein FWG24_04000 [Eggerthellaceae bacterium]|nr:hypothetical protein [Eggerthellaceae bacterium]